MKKGYENLEEKMSLKMEAGDQSRRKRKKKEIKMDSVSTISSGASTEVGIWDLRSTTTVGYEVE